MKLGNELNGASFSEDRTHRYALWRDWAPGARCLFIGLNPSVADHEKDDPTIRKCIGFAKRWGFNGICMLNLFTQVTTDPKKLKPEPLNAEAARLMMGHASMAEKVICCWGAFEEATTGLVRIYDALQLARVKTLYCLGKTKSGAPRHPSRIAYATKLEVFAKWHESLFDTEPMPDPGKVKLNYFYKPKGDNGGKHP